ncbi:lipid droplet-associated hydrolase-like isoform X2 [Cylas formicarius]|uniref:lipid droplet-associated hydrolase-like isoform X2 n=1 Tax=Cylas formicarius TaxID=197179 RepID=UPI002958D606|nr:lipid droplet-associated hydrolase-like isoform X2 [Cylas formicarius]
MQQAFVELNKVRTKILTWGRWIEESQQGTNEVVILIVGNPGTVGFYETFGKTLYQQSNIPVWCVGHAGHNFPTENSFTKLPKFSDNKELYSLKGQIEHKEF